MAVFTKGVVPWNSLDDNTRLPLTSELESGYPCGQADQQLFNFTAAYAWGQVHNAILDTGATVNLTDLTQLSVAIRTSGVIGGRNFLTVNSSTISSPPGSPSQYDVYALPASPTGAWSGQAYKLAWYIGSSWVFVDAPRGTVIAASDTGLYFRRTASAWSSFDATTTDKGIVELATVPESIAGVDNVRAVTPAGLSGAITARGDGFLGVKKFTSSGTYTPSPLAKRIIVEVVGGGGGGGGARATDINYNAIGSGGGGGGYAMSDLAISSITPTVSVTIGSGGSAGGAGSNGGVGGGSSFGPYIAASGGGGGASTGSSQTPDEVVILQGGAYGGIGTGGNVINTTGHQAVASIITRDDNSVASSGGASKFSPGGNGVAGASGTGSNGALGSGGGGGFSGSSPSVGYSGGAGGSGMVLVWEFN